jgi:hypothetical protein
MRVAWFATATQRLLCLTRTSVKWYAPQTSCPFTFAFMVLRPVMTAASPYVRTTLAQFSRKPPSMINSVPVMLLESSESRNLAARATSSDVPNRFKSDLAPAQAKHKEEVSKTCIPFLFQFLAGN